jgi:hypothetical protein
MWSSSRNGEFLGTIEQVTDGRFRAFDGTGIRIGDAPSLEQAQQLSHRRDGRGYERRLAHAQMKRMWRSLSPRIARSTFVPIRSRAVFARRVVS